MYLFGKHIALIVCFTDTKDRSRNYSCAQKRKTQDPGARTNSAAHLRTGFKWGFQVDGLRQEENVEQQH